MTAYSLLLGHPLLWGLARLLEFVVQTIEIRLMRFLTHLNIGAGLALVAWLADTVSRFGG